MKSDKFAKLKFVFKSYLQRVFLSLDIHSLEISAHLCIHKNIDSAIYSPQRLAISKCLTNIFYLAMPVTYEWHQKVIRIEVNYEPQVVLTSNRAHTALTNGIYFFGIFFSFFLSLTHSGFHASIAKSPILIKMRGSRFIRQFILGDTLFSACASMG